MIQDSVVGHTFVFSGLRYNDQMMLVSYDSGFPFKVPYLVDSPLNSGFYPNGEKDMRSCLEIALAAL